MKRTLEYTLTRTRTNSPLAILESPLGNGQEMEPAALRALAQALLDIAHDAERQDTSASSFRASKGKIELAWIATP